MYMYKILLNLLNIQIFILFLQEGELIKDVALLNINMNHLINLSVFYEFH